MPKITSTPCWIKESTIACAADTSICILKSSLVRRRFEGVIAVRIADLECIQSHCHEAVVADDPDGLNELPVSQLVARPHKGRPTDRVKAQQLGSERVHQCKPERAQYWCSASANRVDGRAIKPRFQGDRRVNLPFAGTPEMRRNGQYQQLGLHFCQGRVVAAERAKPFCRRSQARTMEPDQKWTLYIAARLQNRRIDVPTGNGQPLGINKGK